MSAQNISDFKELNVKFNIINERRAEEIMASEYSFAKLRETANVFEKYRSGENRGKYVNTEFAQIYYLTVIEERLCHILMRMCLETELGIKTVLLNDADKIGVADKFLKDYIKSDYDYLASAYPKEIGKYSDGKQADYSLYNFTDTILFGTFDKLVREFYRQYAPLIYNSESAPFEQYLSSLHFIRNKVAHNNSIFGELNEKKTINNSQLKLFLKSKGIGTKTLNTNLSKPIVFDMCNLLHLYCKIQSMARISQNYKELRAFIRGTKKYRKYFKRNENLRSVYNFFRQVISVYNVEI